MESKIVGASKKKSIGCVFLKTAIKEKASCVFRAAALDSPIIISIFAQSSRAVRYSISIVVERVFKKEFSFFISLTSSKNALAIVFAFKISPFFINSKIFSCLSFA